MGWVLGPGPGHVHARVHDLFPALAMVGYKEGGGASRWGDHADVFGIMPMQESGRILGTWSNS